MAAISGSPVDTLVLELRATNKKLRRDVDNAMSGVERRIKKSQQAFRKIAGGFAAAAGVGFALSKVVRDASAYETAVTGVVKTTGLAGDQLKDLEERLGSVTRRFAATKLSLLGLSEAAGQMGVQGSENLARFSETMARMAVASDVAGQEGGKAIVRLLTITGEGVGVIDRFGSTLVDLGNNAAASEAEILHMASRVGQSLASFKVRSADVLGLSAAMKSLDLQAELSGTAIQRAFHLMNKAIQEGGQKSEEMAKRLGVSVGEMTNEFKTQPMQTFVRFLEMLRDKGDRAVITMEEMGLSGTRNAQVFPLLAKNVDLVRDSLDRASGEWSRNTALMNESAQFNKTFAGQVIIFQNALKNLSVTIGQRVLPALTSILQEINFVFDSGEQRVENFELFMQSKFLSLGKWLVDQMVTVGIKIVRSFAVVGSGIIKIFTDSFDLVVRGLEKLANSFADTARIISRGLIDLGKTELPKFEYELLDTEEVEDKLRSLVEGPEIPFAIKTGDFNKFQSELNVARDAYTKMLEAKAKFDSQGIPQNDAAGKLFNLRQGVDELEDAYNSVSQSASKEFGSALDRVSVKAKSLATNTLDGLNNRLQKLNELLRQLPIGSKKFLETQGHIKTIEDKIHKTLYGADTERPLFHLDTAVASMNILMDRTTQFTDALIDGTMKFSDAMKKALGDIAADFAKLIIEDQLTQAFNAFSAASKNSSTGGGGGFWGAVLSGLGSIVGFAKGGRPRVGEPAIVGEQGPEWFVPDSAGTVYPNSFLQPVAAGHTTVVNQYFQSGMTRREFASERGRIIAETKAAVNAEYNRGGNYRRQMQ